MVYTLLTNKAMDISYHAHHGQLDYNGIPYIFHPIHLAEQMDDEISCCVALLHDVVEDTAVTLADLELEFPPAVTQAVDLLTHREGVDYFDYIRSLRTNPIAVKVKLADIAHNADQTRCIGSGLASDDLSRWRDKYRKAQEILLASPLKV